MNNKNLFLLIIAILVGSSFSWFFLHKKPAAVEDTIIVGTNSEFPPFSFQQNGALTGFDIEISTEIARRIGKKIIFKDLPFDALIPEIQIGNIHIIAAGMSPTAERSKIVFFTEPILSNNPLTIVKLKTEKNISAVADLSGKMVAVNEGYLADIYASNLKSVEVYRMSSASVSEGLLALESARADAFITSQASLNPFLKDLSLAAKFSTIVIPDSDEKDALAIAKKYPTLLQEVSIALNDMKKDGTLKTITKKWMSE